MCQSLCLCSMFHCYWISQPLQQLKSYDIGDNIILTRLQQRRQLCKFGAKKGRDQLVFMRADGIERI